MQFYSFLVLELSRLAVPPERKIQLLPAKEMLPTCSQRIPWQHDSEWTTHDTPLPQLHRARLKTPNRNRRDKS